MTGSKSKNVVWNESICDKISNSVRKVEVYSDKTATKLKENAIVEYPVHVVLLIFTKGFRRYIIDHGNTLAVLLAVAKSGIFQDEEEV